MLWFYYPLKKNQGSKNAFKKMNGPSLTVLKLLIYQKELENINILRNIV